MRVFAFKSDQVSSICALPRSASQAGPPDNKSAKYSTPPLEVSTSNQCTGENLGESCLLACLLAWGVGTLGLPGPKANPSRRASLSRTGLPGEGT